MSAFSDTLSQYISDKNVKVYSMAKYCDTDRSSMYKFISGKRNPPSDEIIKKMGQFMHLTPLEWQKLKESWDIARIGADVYYKRKSVESFICNFPDQPSAEFCGCSFTPDLTYAENRSDCISLTSLQHINYYVHQMILSEADRDSGEISLFLQPDYKFLFNLLASLNPSDSLKISQIVCVGTETTFTDDHQLTNLKYLHSVFPLYMAGHDYSLYYYYDKIEAHYHSFNLYPCMILTSDAALLCSSDYQTGIFFRSAEVVRMLHGIYTSYQDQCALFFTPAALTPENHAVVIGSMFNSAFTENDLIGIQPETCLTPFFTGDLLRAIFNYEIPQATSILPLAEQAFQMNMYKIQNQQFFIYSTYEGLLHFVRTGRTDEIPEIFYHPLTIAQRIHVLNEVCKCCESGAYRFLQKPLNHLPANLHFCIRGNFGTMIFKNNVGEILVLNINETKLVEIFRDYLENMEENCFYSIEESISMLQQIIEHLKKMTDTD